MAEIQRRYGDHLYAKHDYDGAVGQYGATIGCLEPSYVIRKFLDAQRIHNLTAYLEALHAKVGRVLVQSAIHFTLTEPQRWDSLEGWVCSLHFISVSQSRSAGTV